MRKDNGYIYVCESKYGFKSDSMKNAEKHNNRDRWIYCGVTSTLNVSVSITFIRTLKSEELFTQRWMLVEITEANKMYTTKRYKRVHHHHHPHVVLPAWISLILCGHFSLSFIASGRSSGLHPVSSQSCCMYVRAARSAFARPYVGVHRSSSLMRSTLLLQQCPACLVRLTWIVFVMGGRWPYSWCLMGCCRQDLFNIARNILV